MRTTLNIDDELLRQLKQRSVKSRVPLRRLVNNALRKGLAETKPIRAKTPYRCPTFPMGEPRIGLDHALAASLEDAEVLRELELRK